MANQYFQFKQFRINQEKAAMKVTTDSCLFGAWCAGIAANKEIRNILDIGTGTGLLSLMLAQQTNAAITAVEIDESAAAEARENFLQSPWKDRIKIITSDFMELEIREKFDLVISNPPFYTSDLKGPSEKRNLAHHAAAMDLEQLIHKASGIIKENGTVFLLLPYKRSDEAKALIKAAGLSPEQVMLVHHSQQHPPSRIMISCGKNSRFQEEKHLFIKDADESYTAEFSKLLKDYYLNL